MSKFYLCCFDVLGQRTVLDGICLQSFSMPRKTDFCCQMMRKMSEKMLTSLREVVSKEGVRLEGCAGVMGAYQFSDSFIVYVKDVADQHAKCVNAFRALLVEIGRWYWEMLEKKMPIRGFVTYGDAYPVKGGSLTGPVFDYREQYDRYADYDRIVFVPITLKFLKDDFGDLIDEHCALDVFAKEVIEKVGMGTIKLGVESLHEKLLGMSTVREILRKDYKTVCALMASGAFREIGGGNGGPYADFDLMAEWPQYPRLRPEDYLVAYLQVRRCRCSNLACADCQNTSEGAVEKVVAHFKKVSESFATNAAEIFREHLCDNIFDMDEKEFVRESCGVDLRVQQVERDILVSVKNESKISVFALAFSLGELSLLMPEFWKAGFHVRGNVVDGCGWLINDGLYGPVVRESYDGMPESQILISEIANEEFRANEIVCRYACQGPDYYFAMPREGCGFVDYRARLLASGMKRDEVLELLARLPSESNRQKDSTLVPCSFSIGLVREIRQFADRLRALEHEGQK